MIIKWLVKLFNSIGLNPFTNFMWELRKNLPVFPNPHHLFNHAALLCMPFKHFSALSSLPQSLFGLLTGALQ